MWNNDIEVSLCRPAEESESFYRNGEGDELIFVHEGSGTLETVFGELSYREHDYVVIPRGTTYRFVPDADRSFWFSTPGAAFAVIAWPVASLGFSFYLSNFAGRGLTYGSLGTAVGLLVFLYISAWIVLLGAEINEVIYRTRRRRIQRR